MTGFGLLLRGLQRRRDPRPVVVGGIAVIRHGVVRATKDVDVVVGTDGGTAAALAYLMIEWEATRPDGSREYRRVPGPG